MPAPPVDLVRFLYVLLRDHVPLGRLNEAVAAAPTASLSNPHLEACARHLATSLLGEAPAAADADEDLEGAGVDPNELDDEGVPYGAICVTCGHTYGEHGAGDRCLFPTGDLRTHADHPDACRCTAMVLPPAVVANMLGPARHRAHRRRR